MQISTHMDAHSAAAMRFCHVLITGPPGIGKTTLCKKVIQSLIERKGLSCDGFYTEEIRSPNNKRIGFDVVPVKHYESRLPLARATHVLESQQEAKFRVGNYAVFIKNFEQIALPVFDTNSEVLLVDEIGKMELLSKTLEEKVNELVFGARDVKKSSICMLATIPENVSSHMLLKKLRSNQRCKIFKLSYENRDDLPEEITEIICNIVKDKI